MAAGVVAIVGWGRGVRLAENRRLLERAEAEGRLRPRGWRAARRPWRSMTVRADGSVELGTRTAAAAARRVATAVPR